MNSDWKNAKTDLPSNDRPVLAVVSGRPPYLHEGFYNKPMMAQFMRGRKPELDCWYVEGFPGWYEAEITYWRDTPPLPNEKSADPVAEVMTTGETRIYQQPEAPEGYKLNPAFIETKSKRVQLLLQPSVHEAIKKIATDEGTSFNDYVSALLKEHAESRGL